MTDKARRKALVKAWAASQSAQARAQFPLPPAVLTQFFAQLDIAMHDAGCFHDTRHAQAVIDALNLTDDQANALLDWCADHGGYCDCEINANTAEYFTLNQG